MKPFAKQVKHVSQNERPLILDLGAGEGKAADLLYRGGLQAVCFDVADSLTRREYPRRSRVQGVAWELPFKDDAFDGVHCKDLLTHIPADHREEMWSELHRVMKPEAVITLVSGRRVIPYISPSQHFTSKLGTIHAMKASGFVVTHVQSWRPEYMYDDWYSQFIKRRFVITAVNGKK